MFYTSRLINAAYVFNPYRNVFSTTKLLVLDKRKYSDSLILGLETSCDDTGCAILNSKGELVAESLHSQNLIHLRNGGIIPDIARDLHTISVEPVVTETLKNAKVSMDAIAAVAVTIKPGLPLSLAVGLKYTKYLARRYNKPIIPIHHMEAHALVARMHHSITFPYMTLLISGGHCLLAVVQDVTHFQLIGESLDMAPGEMFDKLARRIKLRNVPEYSKMCGGQAVELAASKATNPNLFKLPLPLADHRDCNFSFSGLKSSVLYQLYRKELEHQITADKLIPEVNDLCAAILMTTSRHLVNRTQRAMVFCQQNNLIPDDNKQLVVSGGVACNNYIFNALMTLCHEYNYNIFRPSPKLCTDNGVMIAWNGLEKMRQKIDIVSNLNTINIEGTSQLGESLVSKVAEARIPIKHNKMKLRS